MEFKPNKYSLTEILNMQKKETDSTGNIWDARTGNGCSKFLNNFLSEQKLRTKTQDNGSIMGREKNDISIVEKESNDILFSNFL